MVIVQRTPLLRSERALLRPFRPDDARRRQRCGKDAEIIRMFGGSPDFLDRRPMGDDEAAAWYAEVSTDPDPLHWAVEVDGRFVGTARLHQLDEVDRRARYAIGLLDRDVLGIGLGTEITETVVQYGFAQLALHRVDLRVLAYNTRAIRCYQRCGFVLEGREREVAFVDGRWHDELIMGILEHEVDR